jgi:hypothetical protein
MSVGVGSTKSVGRRTAEKNSHGMDDQYNIIIYNVLYMCSADYDTTPNKLLREYSIPTGNGTVHSHDNAASAFDKFSSVRSSPSQFYIIWLRHTFSSQRLC